MRAIDCPGGHRLDGADDELFRLAREHIDRDHPRRNGPTIKSASA